jgi:hypothetical protein
MCLSISSVLILPQPHFGPPTFDFVRVFKNDASVFPGQPGKVALVPFSGKPVAGYFWHRPEVI